MLKYRIHTYDLISTHDGGYEVNDVFPTADIVEINDVNNDDEILNAICSIRNIPRNKSMFQIDGDEITLYISEKSSLKPVMELYLIED